MAKKHSQNSKKTTSGSGHKVPGIRGIIVIFRDDNINAIARSVKTELMCYGEVAMAHTKAMDKILMALALKKTKVII